MRTHSTPESAVRGEITKLAIVECFVAVALYLSIGVVRGTFHHFALAVAIAPLMLFRTDTSAEWGLKIYGQALAHMDHLPRPLDFLSMLVLGPIVGVAIRVVATLYWAVRTPVQTLKAMPQNWVRQSLCTDLLHPPEILPLEALLGDATKVPTFKALVELLREEERGWKIALPFIMMSPFLIVGYVPSIVYRVSFKATSLAYAPFVWIAHATITTPLSFTVRLERITKGELEKVRRALAWLIVSMLAMKIGLVLGWIDLSYIVSKLPSERLMEIVVVPSGWPSWQITSGADALLTFFLLFFADAALARRTESAAWREDTVLRIVSLTSFLRGTFGLMTMSRLCYLSITKVVPASVQLFFA